MALITEAAAKQKFCPNARTFNAQDASGNRWLNDKFDRQAAVDDGGPGRPLNVCMGSACMAWRWEAYRGRKVETEGSAPRGYCGDFGIPMESIV